MSNFDKNLFDEHGNLVRIPEHPIRYWVGFVLETAWYWGIRIIGALILLSMLIGDTRFSQF